MALRKYKKHKHILTLVGWTCCVAFCKIWTTWDFIKLRAFDKHCLNLAKNTGDSLYRG
jgi:hypothetical protein